MHHAAAAAVAQEAEASQKSSCKTPKSTEALIEALSPNPSIRSTFAHGALSLSSLQGVGGEQPEVHGRGCFSGPSGCGQQSWAGSSAHRRGRQRGCASLLGLPSLGSIGMITIMMMTMNDDDEEEEEERSRMIAKMTTTSAVWLSSATVEVDSHKSNGGF